MFPLSNSYHGDVSLLVAIGSDECFLCCCEKPKLMGVLWLFWFIDDDAYLTDDGPASDDTDAGTFGIFGLQKKNRNNKDDPKCFAQIELKYFEKLFQCL